MSWTVTHIESLGIVEMKLVGAVSGDELRAATTEGIALVRKLRLSRGLVDASEQEKTGSMVDLIELPQQYSSEGLSRETRIALPIPAKKELHGIADFYETVCVNRGWQVRTFATRKQAITWLADRPGSE